MLNHTQRIQGRVGGRISRRQRMIDAMKVIQMPTLILGVQSDILFPVWQQKEIADKAAVKSKQAFEEKLAGQIIL